MSNGRHDLAELGRASEACTDCDGIPPEVFGSEGVQDRGARGRPTKEAARRSARWPQAALEMVEKVCTGRRRGDGFRTKGAAGPERLVTVGFRGDGRRDSGAGCGNATSMRETGDHGTSSSLAADLSLHRLLWLCSPIPPHAI